MTAISTHHSSTSTSAIIYSNDLIHQLENNPSIRLPSTYIGVRRIRLKLVVAVGRSDISKVDDNNDRYPNVKKRKHSSDIKDNKDDDEWVPNYNVSSSNNSSSFKPNNTTTNNQQSSTKSKEEDSTNVITYKVTNPDGTQRRMTTQEKKQLKYQLKQSKHKLKKDEKQRKHEQHNLYAKRGKMERRQMKRFGRMNNDDDDVQANQQQQQEDEEKVDDEKSNCSVEVYDEHTNHDGIEATTVEKNIPPVMLTPAATCVARDMGILSSVQEEEAVTSSYHSNQTTMDPILAAQWATQLQQSMIPAETSRGKEEMRPMAYRLVPEAWKRLCPDTLLTDKDSKEEEEDCVKKSCSLEMADNEMPISSSSATSLAIMRNPSPSFDTDASIIFRHLHQHSELHLSCGAVFGCDFLLYDGKRDERHSFAGLRIYSSNDKDDEESQLPIPTAYDLMGFVRSMNTARKIALIATVVRSGEDATPRVLIVDLALEKVLTAPTHIRKGNTVERRSEEESASGLAKQRL